MNELHSIIKPIYLCVGAPDSPHAPKLSRGHDLVPERYALIGKGLSRSRRLADFRTAYRTTWIFTPTFDLSSKRRDPQFVILVPVAFRKALGIAAGGELILRMVNRAFAGRRSLRISKLHHRLESTYKCGKFIRS